MRFWRPPSRVAATAWGGLLSGLLLAFTVGLPPLVAALGGALAAAAIFSAPLASWRREPMLVTVGDGTLEVRQGARCLPIRLETVRSARVLTAVGERRYVHGWGLSWGHAGRRVWDMPVPGLGMVRIERDHRGLDLDLASAHPEQLVAAIREGADA
jgi:hypothetical protein